MNNVEEFTFISLTYNQEKYITEHLNSIKYLISTFGQGMKFDYILADDCSKDGTVSVASEWVEKNAGLFRNIIILSNKENQGVVRNLVAAMKKCRTANFKFLAGDDKYYKNNIFELYENINNKILISPVIPFGESVDKADFRWYSDSYFMLKYACEKGKLNKLQRVNNFIPAAGVFFDVRELITDEFTSYIYDYRNIEDYPMWRYLIDTKRYDVSVLTEPYVEYRINSGISNNKSHEKRKSFDEELIKMHKELDVKYFKYPKYLNPYRYWLKILQIKSKKSKEKAINVMSDNLLKEYYK